jgi:hypothetical protein
VLSIIIDKEINMSGEDKNSDKDKVVQLVIKPETKDEIIKELSAQKSSIPGRSGINMQTVDEGSKDPFPAIPQASQQPEKPQTSQQTSQQGGSDEK